MNEFKKKLRNQSFDLFLIIFVDSLSQMSVFEPLMYLFVTSFKFKFVKLFRTLITLLKQVLFKSN